MSRSLLEQILAQDLKDAGIPFVEEFEFAAPERRWRADFAFPQARVLVEVEGGAGFGRHTKREGFLKDAAKYAAAARLGWIVLRFSSAQVRGRMGPGMDSEAIETIRCALKYWGEESA